MKRGLNVVAAFVAGALAMFLLERYLTRAQRVVPAGRLAQARSGAGDDARLREEVRTRLGAWVSHPRAIEVEVQNGIVRVSGQVLAAEIDGLLMQLTGVRGVHKVHNALSVLQDPSGFAETTRVDPRSPLH